MMWGWIIAGLGLGYLWSRRMAASSTVSTDPLVPTPITPDITTSTYRPSPTELATLAVPGKTFLVFVTNKSKSCVARGRFVSNGYVSPTEVNGNFTGIEMQDADRNKGCLVALGSYKIPIAWVHVVGEAK